jgi:hypothetical protein
MAKRAAIYLRVSTDEQTTDNQERALRVVAARSAHEIVAVYRDEGISGAKGRDKRPGFDAMHKDASRRNDAARGRGCPAASGVTSHAAQKFGVTLHRGVRPASPRPVDCPNASR